MTQQELYALADLKAVVVAGRNVLYHDERGQGVQYATAMAGLALALNRPRVKALLEGLK